jgi:hypothetical protein
MGSNLVSSNILDGNSVMTMPGSISVPNSGSFKNKEKCGTSTKNIGKNNKVEFYEMELTDKAYFYWISSRNI